MIPGRGTGGPRKASASKKKAPTTATASSSSSSSSVPATTFELVLPGCVLIRNALLSIDDQQRWIDDCLEYGEGRVPGVTSFFEGSLTTKDGYFDMNGAAPSSTADAVAPAGADDDDGVVTKKKKELNLITKARTYVPIALYSERSGEWVALAKSLLKKAQELTEIPDLDPEQARINYYTNKGKIGWHFDRVPGLDMAEQWRVQSPIVSFSLGNAAEFCYRMERDAEPQTIVLNSGDCIIFGGAARMIWHAVPKVLRNTKPADLSLRSLEFGRLNVGFY